MVYTILKSNHPSKIDKKITLAKAQCSWLSGGTTKSETTSFLRIKYRQHRKELKIGTTVQ